MLGTIVRMKIYKDKDGNWMTPRQYLRNKGWLERRRVGLDGLRKVGVLK